MRYSQDLPLEEKQRLDQIHLKQGGVNPYGTDLNNENSGLNSMFPPRPEPIKPEGVSDQDWQGYLAAKAEVEKQRATGDLGRDVRRGEAGYEHWKQGQGQQGYLSSLMEQPDPLRKDVGSPLWEPPAPTFVSDISTQPTTMPLPQPPGTGGFSQLPTTMPRPFGRPFGGGGGKGGNFLGRFERLLDGLEGLVGKLGESGGTSESPFPTGDGGGLAEVIQTPFTPTQDY
tara:strand:+ start:541 stop:1224 length:684 start_codon:yes stop_codon:yes gene_type:complete